MSPAPLTRFSVAPLAGMKRRLADVGSGRVAPDLVITGARILSTYSDRVLTSAFGQDTGPWAG